MREREREEREFTLFSSVLCVDMAKRAGRVGFGSGQSGRGSKRVTGQNGSFLNGSIGLRVKRVAG